MTANEAAPESRFKRNTFIRADELRPADIGQTIRFRQWDNNTEIARVLTGELRQLSANGGEIHICIGLGASTEETLFNDQPVTLRPTDQYNDVPTLALYDDQV
ncbi:hypothetical protein SEA_MUDSLIDE_57 [Mycobacterium phage Mudslide]|uniref:Uncharacterized protein n=1 Tax=Mycobacterium phage Hydro TaxID=2801894 RepID=A0A7U0J7I6_9CAUD|nr:hypothetical protein SEA_HYDRO_57 [Mycobacterium phage Hydro]UVK59534.1 hypothetical protein SEA_AUSTELLE_58 [Mycobacterium phage Austelle]WNM65075.1 hypothetical protein SEA_MUDSLIDE_57 [Mycobacterium phage Mudslide]